MSFFPLFIDLSRKRCMVAGGGKVAERKVRELLKHNAEVVVVSLSLTRSLKALSVEKKISYRPSCFDEKYVDDVFLLIDATGSRDVRKKISKIASDRKILVNIVNEPSLSDFLTPAIFSRGDLKIAVSTSGNSPALAARIKKDLSLVYGPEYGVFLELLGKSRKKILEKIEDSDARKKVFQSIIESDIIDLISKGNMEGAELFCDKIINVAAESSIRTTEQGEGAGRAE